MAAFKKKGRVTFPVVGQQQHLSAGEPDRSKGHLQIKEFIADQVCLTPASSCGARGTAYKHQALLHFVSFIIMYIILWEGGWKWVTAQQHYG